MTKKNLGPCAIKECDKSTDRFRTFTINCKNKAIAKGTYNYYNVEVGLQLCHSHYLKICEPDRHVNYNKKKLKNNNKENHIIRDRNPTNYCISGNSNN